MLRRFCLALGLLSLSAVPALALPCSAYPNTLTNGTLADANQVMANFNNILNCVNALAPLPVPVVGAWSNIKENLGAAGTTTTVTADSITVGTALNGSSYTLTSYSQSFNGATVGAGGMDTGTLPTSSYVAIYAIYNPTAPAISILGTTCALSCPTVYGGANLPAGYTASALLTVLPTNGSAQMVINTVRGKSIDFVAKNVLNTGTNQASPTALSLVSAVPPDAIGVKTYVQINPSSNAAGVFSITTSDDASASGQQACAAYMAASASGAVGCPVSIIWMQTAQQMYWNSTNISGSAAALINVSGYVIP